MNRAQMIRAFAAHTAAAKALRDALEEQAREEVAAGTRPSWELADGSRVTASRTTDAVVVLDEDAFIAWARRTRPDEIMERTVVEFRNPKVRAMVLEQWGLKATELPPFLARRPGGEFKALSISWAGETKERLAALAARYAAGELPAMPELEA